MSFPLSWKLYELGISANMISIFALLLAVVSSLFVAWPSRNTGVVGALLFNVVAFLDCVDGNVARATESGSDIGEWFDALVGYSTYALLPVSLGLGIDLAWSGEISTYSFIGALTGLSSILPRLVYQKYKNVSAKNSKKKSSSYIRKMYEKVSNEISLGGFMMPTLLVAVLIGAEASYLYFYLLFNASVAIGTPVFIATG